MHAFCSAVEHSARTRTRGSQVYTLPRRCLRALLTTNNLPRLFLPSTFPSRTLMVVNQGWRLRALRAKSLCGSTVVVAVFGVDHNLAQQRIQELASVARQHLLRLKRKKGGVKWKSPMVQRSERATSTNPQRRVAHQVWVNGDVGGQSVGKEQVEHVARVRRGSKGHR